MAEFPKQFAFPDPLPVISTSSPAALLGGMNYTGTALSATWPTSNLAIFVPFILTRPYIVTNLFCINGATASGNIDIGIYSEDGTRLVSKGSTAQAGTNTTQNLSVTSTELGAGLFYLALACNNTTATFNRYSTAANTHGAYGTAQMASAFALPATATFATTGQSYIPIVGLTGRSVL